MLSFFLFLTFIMLSIGHPIDRVIEYEINRVEESLAETPKWYNHCKAIPESSNLLVHKLSESKSETIIRDLFQKVEKSSLISLRRAEDIKQRYKQITDFEKIFDDFESLRLQTDFKWLPSIPSISEEIFNDMTKEMALLKAHEYVEKFAVALEQIVVDKNNREVIDMYSQTIDRRHFKNIDDDNYSVLCEIRIAMSVVFGSVNEHFLTRAERSIMPETDRNIGEMSKRMLRDYLILRQYVKTTQFINKLFEYYRQKL